MLGEGELAFPRNEFLYWLFNEAFNHENMYTKTKANSAGHIYTHLGTHIHVYMCIRNNNKEKETTNLRLWNMRGF